MQYFSTFVSRRSLKTAKTFVANNTSLLITALMVVLFSCGAGNGAQTNTPTLDPAAASALMYDTTLPNGVVTDSVACRKEGGQTYALYLPSFYTPERSFPCLFFFDAHARGSMPVRAYKGIAEKYGFVFVGSNVSQNGTPWEVTSRDAQILMDDTRTRINIDSKRIYTSGFSGGARVAASIAILQGGIAGVIGSAAGFPQVQQPLQNKFDYFGIVGDYDFNLGEMEQLDMALEQNGFTHQLLTSSGIHGWPSATDFQTGLLWLQLNAMKTHLQPVNDTLIKTFKTDFDKRIATATLAKDWTKARNLVSGTERALNGLADITAYRQQLAELDNSAVYKSAVAARELLRQKETMQQQELQKQFPVQSEQWWAHKIGQLNKEVHHAKTPQEALMNKRLVNYLGLIGYMYSDRALKTGDLPNAAKYLAIFKLADPKNPDCGYLSALYFMQKGDKHAALASLSEAVSVGYSEAAKLKTEPAFKILHDDAGFMKIITKATENALAK